MSLNVYGLALLSKMMQVVTLSRTHLKTFFCKYGDEKELLVTTLTYTHSTFLNTTESHVYVFMNDTFI